MVLRPLTRCTTRSTSWVRHGYHHLPRYGVIWDLPVYTLQRYHHLLVNGSLALNTRLLVIPSVFTGNVPCISNELGSGADPRTTVFWSVHQPTQF